MTESHVVLLPCSCGHLEHTIRLESCSDGPASVEMIVPRLAFRQRLRLVWRLLVGREALVADAVFGVSELRKLAAWSFSAWRRAVLARKGTAE